jgi:S-adenosylmethionine:tRNA ribosyltransferase-isomerase
MRPAEDCGALAFLERYGHVPLPPYIRSGEDEPADRERYQTIYARQPGSVAAPTAGLHFTAQLLSELRMQGIEALDVTLHVGPGTFRPITAQQVDEHRLDPEWVELTTDAAAHLNKKKAHGGRVVAVGTTSCRVLESAWGASRFEAFTGETSIYLRPGHRFRGADALITNFHLPKSSLLVLVAAFAGIELTRRAYEEAVRSKYRFYSYGDAMLIL